MPTLIFLIIATTGLLITRTLIRIVRQQKINTRQVSALTMAFGLAITFYFSFFVPVAVSNNFVIEYYLFVFIFESVRKLDVVTLELEP